MPVTEAELFAVCISQKVLELYHGMPFQKPLESAFAKITRSLDDERLARTAGALAARYADVMRDA